MIINDRFNVYSILTRLNQSNKQEYKNVDSVVYSSGVVCIRQRIDTTQIGKNAENS